MPTIGETLREAREKQKISVDVAAKAVKVKNEILEGIEQDDFSKFAAPLYARGILRLYANFLGLEPETLVEEYNKANPATQPKSSDQFAVGERDQVMARRRAVVISTVSKPSDLSSRGIAGLVAVVVLLGAVIWILSASRKPKTETVEPLVAPSMTEAQKQQPQPVAQPEPPTVPSLSLGTEAAPPSTNSLSGAVPAIEVQPEENQ